MIIIAMHRISSPPSAFSGLYFSRSLIFYLLASYFVVCGLFMSLGLNGDRARVWRRMGGSHLNCSYAAHLLSHLRNPAYSYRFCSPHFILITRQTMLTCLPVDLASRDAVHYSRKAGQDVSNQTKG